MGLTSEIVHIFKCARCQREDRTKPIIRVQNDAWPEAMLPPGWAELGYIGLWCSDCYMKLRKIMQ
jgi:hypothetical protein